MLTLAPLRPCGTPDLQPHSGATSPSNTLTVLQIHQPYGTGMGAQEPRELIQAWGRSIPSLTYSTLVL